MNVLVNTTVLSNFAVVDMSLAIAKCRSWRFLTDDSAARKQADEWGVPKAGTLALLVQAIDGSLITPQQGNLMLQDMLAHRYQSPVTSLDDLIP